MRKVEIIELVQEILADGIVTDDVAKKYHSNVISAGISLLMEDIASSSIKTSAAMLSDLDIMTKTDCIEAKYDKKRCEYQVEIPSLMGLPMNLGVRSVLVANDSREVVDIIPQNIFNNLSGVDAGAIIPSGYLQGRSIWFRKQYSPSYFVTYVPEFHKLSDDDDVFIIHSRFAQLIQASRELFNYNKSESYNNNPPDN